MAILLTGAAGYIGSHICLEIQKNYPETEVIAVDDLSTGVESRLSICSEITNSPAIKLYNLDISKDSATPILRDIMTSHGVNAVIHLAAKKRVDESVAEPIYYVQQNVGGLTNLLEAMRLANTMKLVFSSSAAVYGSPETTLVTEDTPTHPESPYGETKLFGELMIRNAASAWGLRATALRYFNVAGTADSRLLDTAASNLVPITLKRIRAGQPAIVFGTDYDTRDGSCIRDYIHVKDLARAHALSLDYLQRQPKSAFTALNLGTSKGTTVLELLSTLKVVSGIDFDIHYADRRPGDPAALVANHDKASDLLGWRPQETLAAILESEWHA